MITAKEFLSKALIEKGYDGLCFPEQDCGCLANDLAPCESDPWSCFPGVKRIKDDGDWEIVRIEKETA